MDCVNFGKINAKFRENRSAGGVVGYNNRSGVIKSCNSVADVNFVMTSSDSRTLAPAIGRAVGFNDGGIANVWAMNTVNAGSLYTVTWKEGGFLGIGGTTKTHNQAMYVGGLIGKSA